MGTELQVPVNRIEEDMFKKLIVYQHNWVKKVKGKEPKVEAVKVGSAIIRQSLTSHVKDATWTPRALRSTAGF